MTEDTMSEYSEYYDDYYAHYDYNYYKLEGHAETARLPRRSHELKHGRLITHRGSNQEKFTSMRPKALIKYGKCDVPSNYEFDEITQSIINDTVDKNHYCSYVNDVIPSGERSVLLHCFGHRPLNKKGKPYEYLLKVYRLEFGMERIKKWALNEYQNSRHMNKHANVPNIYCPTRNVVELKFIGDDGKPAPSLNEVTFEITEKIYTDVVTSMYKIYNDGKRVHGNLSARTILWWREKLYFISLSHGVEANHPNALRMLMKDCCHVTHFFKSKGLLKVKSIMNLFKYITGINQPDAEVLLALKYTRRKVKNKQKKKKLPHESF